VLSWLCCGVFGLHACDRELCVYFPRNFAAKKEAWRDAEVLWCALGAVCWLILFFPPYIISNLARAARKVIKLFFPRFLP
jgi:hypothetical protein